MNSGVWCKTEQYKGSPSANDNACFLWRILFITPYGLCPLQLFHSVLHGYGSVGSVFLALLGTGSRGMVASWQPWSLPACPGWAVAFHCSFAVLKLALLWVVTSALLRNYRCAREELYRPAVDLQDYEMVELFLRRLKIWMGLSRTKEVRERRGMLLPVLWKCLSVHIQISMVTSSQEWRAQNVFVFVYCNVF